MKKIYLILITFIVLLVVAFSVWFFFGRDKTIPVGDAVSNLLPFGSGSDIQNNITNDFSNITDSNVVGGEGSKYFDDKNIPVNKLFPLSEIPVAGSVIFIRSGESIVRYTDSATGHINEVILPKNTASSSLVRRRITNTTIPKIYEVYFSPNGNSVLYRSIKDDVDTNTLITLGSATATSTEGLLYNVSANNLRGEIGSVGVGTNATLYYSLKDSNLIVASTFGGTNIKNLFSSAFTDWSLKAYGQNGLIAQTKAGSVAEGYAYDLNTSTGSLSKVIGPLNGLSVTPDSTGSKIFYSYNDGRGIKSGALNTKTKETTSVNPPTFAEKCVWSVRKLGIIYCGDPIKNPSSNEPESWYQGITHYSDRIWEFDTNTDLARLLVEPKLKYDLDLDVINPQLSPNEDYLIFMNKTDLSLWALKLE